MFGLLKTRHYAIGADLNEEGLRLVQLAENGNTLELVAGRNKNRPSQIEPGSGPWQRWAIQTIRLFTSNGQFRGRNVTAAIPPAELFIDNIRISRSNDDRLQDAAFSRIKPLHPTPRPSHHAPYL